MKYTQGAKKKKLKQLTDPALPVRSRACDAMRHIVRYHTRRVHARVDAGVADPAPVLAAQTEEVSHALPFTLQRQRF